MGWLSRIFKKPAKSVPQTSRKSYSEILPELKIADKYQVDVRLLVDKFNKTQERYHVVSHMTGVPVDVLFALHYRESSLDFTKCLHNGDKLPGPTHNVPKGRGPFKSWEEAAIDAIELEKHKFPKSWDIVGKLEFCEIYNGLGYKNRGVPSPYVLSWTNGYSCGKYVADGKYDSSFVDKQCGTAAIILGIGMV